MNFNMRLFQFIYKIRKNIQEFVITFLFALLALSYYDRVYNLINNYETSFDVIVVGAGFSGIGVATSLHENGIDNFLVLEAKHYKGGRVYQENFDGVHLPLGAGWVHKIEQEGLIWSLVKQYGIKHHYDNYDDLTYREPGVHQSLQEEWEQMSDLLQNVLVSHVPSFMKTQATALSLAEALHAVGWRATSKLEKAVEYLAIDFENGNPANRLSAQYFPITGEGQDVIITDPRGYESITDIISQPFHKKILLNHRVLSIKHSNKHYTVQTANGKIFRSKYVMLSVSHQVLQNNKINFDPQLPVWKIQSLDKIATGDYCKIFLNYPFKFWDDSNYIMIGQTTKEYIHWQNIQRIYVNKNILMVTLTGEECKRSQKEPDSLVISKAQYTLSQVYGEIPSPLGILRSNWSNDPYVLGAYSHPTKETTTEDIETIRRPVFDRTLWFTGEHVGGFDRMGYAGGALETGIESGKELAQYILSMRD